MKSYTHPSYVPVGFALAVYRILMNQAIIKDWELVDSYPRNKSIEWYKEIMISNEMHSIPQEVAWFGGQLCIQDN